MDLKTGNTQILDKFVSGFRMVLYFDNYSHSGIIPKN
jgi:hypothetical protein